MQLKPAYYSWLGSRQFAALILLTLAALTFWINFPGHISVDAIIQLHEGKTGNYQSFNPPFMGYLMGMLDRTGVGLTLFGLLNLALFYTSLYLLLPEQPAQRFLALLGLVAVCLGPVLLIYNGTIWKDVFFANLSLFGFSMLASASPGRLRLSLALIAFAAAILVRQQGLLIALFGAYCFAMLKRESSWQVLVWRCLLAFAATVVISKLCYALILSSGIQVRDPGFSTGLAVLMMYDIAGAAYHGGAGVLDVFSRHGLDITAIMAEVSAHYSPTRQDFLRFDTLVHAKMVSGSLLQQWLSLLLHHPGDYLAHRTDAFMWLLGAHDVKLCAPIHLGVNGPDDLAAQLGLNQLKYPRLPMLWDYASSQYEGPLFRPWVHVAIAGLCVAWLARQVREALPRALLILLLSGLAYVATYFLLSMACDFRYTYLLVAATQVTAALLLPNLLAAMWRIWRRLTAA